jgi:O-methyltransferase
MFLSRLIERLGTAWRVIGFDTFDEFPPRHSPLDMYDHPGCVFTDLPAVRRYLHGRDIEIIAGDIADTCRRLEREDLVLSFINTDNYTPAKAAIDVVRERTVPGFAIVFDHFSGTGRFRCTFHLHGTGVFYRQGAVR